MSEPFGWSISTSPLGEELLVEGLLVEELQGSTPQHDVCSSPMHLQEVNTIVLFVINLCADDVIAVLMGVIFLLACNAGLRQAQQRCRTLLRGLKTL